MANSTMMECKSCGKQISRKAESCPYCGHAYVKSFSARLQTAQKFTLYLSLIIFALIFALLIWSGSRS